MLNRSTISALFVGFLGAGLWADQFGSALATRAMLATVGSLRAASPPPQPGTFPDSWNAGLDCANEPDFQVHAYNDDFYIIRQSKCVIYEAPFLYLMFGDEKALLLDTGSSTTADVYGTVMRIVDHWLADKAMDSIPLIVAHSHSHADHFLGDDQFIGQPGVELVVPTTKPEALRFWGFEGYPLDKPTLDLGNRVIDVLGTPGHNGVSVTLYDRRTQLMLSGDVVYPGHLFIYQPFEKFRRSIRRMAIWASENPVQWVLGGHIEMSSIPYRPYRYGTQAHPLEHDLQFHPRELLEIYLAAREMGDEPHCEIFDEFVIQPMTDCSVFWNGD